MKIKEKRKAPLFKLSGTKNTNFELRKWKAFSSFGQSFFFINKSDKN